MTLGWPRGGWPRPEYRSSCGSGLARCTCSRSPVRWCRRPTGRCARLATTSVRRPTRTSAWRFAPPAPVRRDLAAPSSPISLQTRCRRPQFTFELEIADNAHPRHRRCRIHRFHTCRPFAGRRTPGNRSRQSQRWHPCRQPRVGPPTQRPGSLHLRRGRRQAPRAVRRRRGLQPRRGVPFGRPGRRAQLR